MDDTVLSPEIIKQCNPGISDFGTGTLMALASQCLRCAKRPTPCEICLEFCPAAALNAGNNARPHASTDCLRCGACVGVCPTNALAGASRTIQQANNAMLKASLRTDRLAITCERSLALLRLQALTDQPEAAQAALKLAEQSSADDRLLKVPCLGMLPREFWFSALNEVGVSKLEEVAVWLPPGQCASCPVNAKDNVEELFSAAISTAELWAARSVALIASAEELPLKHKPNVRAYLASETEVDRRGMFTGFLGELRESWEQNAQVGNQALAEVEAQRARKATFERTRLSAAIKARRTGGKNPIAVPVRYILMEALGRNDERADDIAITVSCTDLERCNGCGECLEVCPVHARQRQPQAEPDAEVVVDIGAGTAGEKTEATTAGAATGAAAAAATTATATAAAATTATAAAASAAEVTFEASTALGSALMSSATPTFVGPSTSVRASAAAAAPVTATGSATGPAPEAATGSATGPAPEAAAEPATGSTTGSTTGSPLSANSALPVITETLFCLACSACLQACPEGAVHFSEISAREYLL
jgi:ferredoxin